MDQLIIKTQHHDSDPCLDIKGACDQSGLDALIKAFQKILPKVKGRLYLRLTELSYMDSSALGVIMFNLNELSRKNQKMIILEPSDEMKQLFKATSLDKVLTIE